EGIHWLRQFLKDYADAGNGVFVSSHLLSEMSLMADNLVVIGKGKLITTGTVSDLINGAKGANVLVRTTKASVLQKALQARKINFEKTDGGLKVYHTETDEIGKLAFELNVPILELSKATV